MLPLASSALLALANCVAKQPEKECAAIPHQQSFPHANIIVLTATCFCLIASTPSLCLFAPTTGYMPTSETPKTYLFSFLIAIAMAGIMMLHKPFPIKQGIILIILGALLILSSLALALTDNAMPFAATTHTCFQFSLFLSLLSFCAKKRGGELEERGVSRDYFLGHNRVPLFAPYRISQRIARTHRRDSRHVVDRHPIHSRHVPRTIRHDASIIV